MKAHTPDMRTNSADRMAPRKTRHSTGSFSTMLKELDLGRLSMRPSQVVNKRLTDEFRSEGDATRSYDQNQMPVVDSDWDPPPPQFTLGTDSDDEDAFAQEDKWLMSNTTEAKNTRKYPGATVPAKRLCLR